MSTRDFAFVALKLTGLLFLVDAISSFVNLLILLRVPSEPWSVPSSVVASSVAQVVIYAVVSFGCLFLTNTITWLLLGEDSSSIRVTDVSQGLLSVGVILIGAFLLANNFSASVRFALEYANPEASAIVSEDGNARDVFYPYSFREGVLAVGNAFVGIVLVFLGRAVASRKIRPGDRYDGDSAKGAG